MLRPPTRLPCHSHWRMHSCGSTHPEFINAAVFSPFRPCAANAHVPPTLSAQLSGSFSIFIFWLPWRWLSSFCANGILTLLAPFLSLLLSSYYSSFFFFFFSCRSLRRSSQTINLIDVPHVHSTSSHRPIIIRRAIKHSTTCLFSVHPTVECRSRTNCPTVTSSHRPLGYWTLFKRIIFFSSADQIVLWPYRTTRPFFSFSQTKYKYKKEKVKENRNNIPRGRNRWSFHWWPWLPLLLVM